MGYCHFWLISSVNKHSFNRWQLDLFRYSKWMKYLCKMFIMEWITNIKAQFSAFNLILIVITFYHSNAQGTIIQGPDVEEIGYPTPKLFLINIAMTVKLFLHLLLFRRRCRSESWTGIEEYQEKWLYSV